MNKSNPVKPVWLSRGLKIDCVQQKQQEQDNRVDKSHIYNDDSVLYDLYEVSCLLFVVTTKLRYRMSAL